jgi:hypothetical protein
MCVCVYVGVWLSYGHDGVVGHSVSDITVFPVTATTSTALRLLTSVQDSRHWHHYTRNKGTNITPRSLKLAHDGCVRACVFSCHKGLVVFPNVLITQNTFWLGKLPEPSSPGRHVFRTQKPSCNL